MESLVELLRSLSDSERDFIANLSNRQEAGAHRRQLDLVIANGGVVDFTAQCWTPYEVIDLGKNVLEIGHEREFAACNGIALLNISTGNDRSNDPNWVFANFLSYSPGLDEGVVAMVAALARAAFTQAEKDGGIPWDAASH
jgi:hypothetical protein